ncbi:MAG: UbiA family prenyltransferase [Anaerolineaceae bacterium]|nr:UbiA family prenyltransferase [Anaerolineaceae bacterium]
MTARCPVTHWPTLLGLTGSLLLAISGSTILNMWYDRDIDAVMPRTARRPLPSGKISPAQTVGIGLFLSAAGVLWAFFLSAGYGVAVLAGLIFDVLVYTIWLKRLTAWSIVWGGISGGMPVLAGRILGVGQLDWVGILLALAVLFWIPTHIMTFSIRYSQEYSTARIPTFPSHYGVKFTRSVISASSILTALAMISAGAGIGLSWGILRLLGVLSMILLAWALAAVIRPSPKINFGLFKFASFYMLGSMLLLTL